MVALSESWLTLRLWEDANLLSRNRGRAIHRMTGDAIDQSGSFAPAKVERQRLSLIHISEPTRRSYIS
jgi:hypothetical protein